jgi:pyruvate dehydrogenase E2 component (dihydrolipoamide acetyltransferase)
MAIPITIPRLGWNMDEGTFVGWLKPDGAAVRPGEPLFSLESDKATQEIECLDAGILRIAPDGPRAGDKVTVGTVIGYLAPVGEAVPARAADVHRDRRHVPISPRAKRLAAKLGIDWARLKGSGRTGRIRERDVRAAAPRVREGTSVPVNSIRQTIAVRMLNSHRSTAPVTLTTTVDATHLVLLRNQFQAALSAGSDIVPSYTDFLVKLAGIALEKHPLLNARWDGEQIQIPEGIHIGIAVDTDAGLLVPVLRDVPALSLKQVAVRSRDLVERARQGKLTAAELQGGTFTVTNLGAFGIDSFTPIIHFPQCAILGLGRIQRRPVVSGNDVVIRDQLTLNLTFDHRIVDGAPAARFVQTLGVLLENPGPWFMP